MIIGYQKLFKLRFLVKLMFKKKCPKCEEKVGKGSNFCFSCGQNLRDPSADSEDYGFLGRDDSGNDFENMFNDIPISRIIRGAMKMTEKMMKNLSENQNNMNQNHNHNQHEPNMDISFFVNGKRVNLQNKHVEKGKSVSTDNVISERNVERLAKLPRKEPKTKMKRLSGKLVYELYIPGVEDIEDVLINQLENSIEIKAISNDKIYSKTLMVNLPILNCELEGGSLILELQSK